MTGNSDKRTGISHAGNVDSETRQVDHEDLEVYLHESVSEQLESVSELRVWVRVAREYERESLWLS